MFYVVHVLLGGIIGLHYSSVALIVFIAFLSHFLIDNIPHWDLGFDRENFKENYSLNFSKKTVFVGFIDAVIAISLILFLYDRFSDTHVVIGCIASVFPDVLSLGYFTKIKHKKKYKKFIHFHNQIQRDARFLPGILTQAALVFIFLEVLF